MPTRTERYSKIKNWLGDAFEQNPSPHKILSQMLVEEQALTNRLTNTGQPWALSPPVRLDTSAGNREYTVNSPGGKIYFVGKITDSGAMIPVPFNDYNQPNFTANNLTGEWIGANYVGSDTWGNVGQGIAFYRSSDDPQSLKAVLSGVPQTSEIFSIVFFSGSLDRQQAALENSGIAEELSDYMDLRAAIALLPYAFWRKETGGDAATRRENIEYNRERRKELAAGLLFQLQSGVSSIEMTVEKYIKQLNAPTSFSLGHWNS